MKMWSWTLVLAAGLGLAMPDALAAGKRCGGKSAKKVRSMTSCPRRDCDNNPPGPKGGPGTNWENPPGKLGGPGASPDVEGDAKPDLDNNPPGPKGGPGTNWENPPGKKGGPGASPDCKPKFRVRARRGQS